MFPSFCTFGDAQQLVWQGRQPDVIAPEDLPGALYLALDRWGHSRAHLRLIAFLWRQKPDCHRIKWGDTTWGGSLSLLDLALDRELHFLIKRCSKLHITPTDRSWRIALSKDDGQGLILLGQYFPPPEWLPGGNPLVQAMLSARTRKQLEQDTANASGSGQGRRL